MARPARGRQQSQTNRSNAASSSQPAHDQEEQPVSKTQPDEKPTIAESSSTTTTTTASTTAAATEGVSHDNSSMAAPQRVAIAAPPLEPFVGGKHYVSPLQFAMEHASTLHALSVPPAKYANPAQQTQHQRLLDAAPTLGVQHVFALEEVTAHSFEHRRRDAAWMNVLARARFIQDMFTVKVTPSQLQQSEAELKQAYASIAAINAQLEAEVSQWESMLNNVVQQRKASSSSSSSMLEDEMVDNESQPQPQPDQDQDVVMASTNAAANGETGGKSKEDEEAALMASQLTTTAPRPKTRLCMEERVRSLLVDYSDILYK
jgi:hypothetical protein